MKDKQTYEIELEKSMYAFLEEMTQKYYLPDVGKAVRCLVNFARDSDSSVLDEIFEEIRCLDC